MKAPKTVVGVLDDLMFTVKILEAAKQAGFQTVFVKTKEAALARAAERPAVMILDLNCAAAQPLEIAAALKSQPEYKGISVIGYLSHVQAELKQRAQETGIDMVLARSAFSTNLPQILRRHSVVA
jgi:PleD family two-component response regulator